MTFPTTRDDREFQKFKETSNGDTAVRTITSDSLETSLYDISSSTVIYTGSAPQGSLPNDSVWSLVKIDLSTSVISIKKSSANQAWDNRESVLYE